MVTDGRFRIFNFAFENIIYLAIKFEITQGDSECNLKLNAVNRETGQM